MTEPIRVGVLGARGRMGQEVCKAVDAAPDLDLVAMVDAGDWLFSVADAGAQTVVAGFFVEKIFQNGRRGLEQMGIPVATLAQVERLEGGKVVMAGA